MRGISMGTLNYPGYHHIEEYQRSFFYQSNDYLELPWLNLLCYLPLREAQQGQPVTVGHYIVLRSIYDKNEELFLFVKEQLKEIFPHSFLFQELEAPLQYCKDCSDILTLERLKTLSQQMTALDSLDHLEEEMILAESIRAIWRETQMLQQHMTLDAFDYENALWFEDYQKLTWFIPFSDKYPVTEKAVKRYLLLYLTEVQVMDEITYRNTIMELENFIQFDADVFTESLKDIVYDLEDSINDTAKLKKTVTQLINTIDVYGRQRAKISTPPVDPGFSMIRQRLRGI